MPSALCFGVLQSSSLEYETGCGVSFNFLHLTIQEYLAALHLMRQPLDFQLEILHSHIQSSSGISDMALQFFFGVLFSRDIEKDSIDSIMHHATGMHMSLLERMASAVFPQPLHLSHCAFEARNNFRCYRQSDSISY